MEGNEKGNILPSEDVFKVDAMEGAIFRRLSVAPDYSEENGGEVIATWSASTVPVFTTGEIGAGGFRCLRYTDTATWVRLASPAVDVAWCPFKKGNTDASFLTASRGVPLQLWDMEDGAPRASYCCHNSMGMPAHPHSVLWTPHRELIAAGYGGPHDNVHIRLYNVLREGHFTESYYRSPCSKGIVSALSDGPLRYRSSLILAGFIRSGNVDVVDTRHCGAAATLHGLKSGVAQVLSHPTSDCLVYAAGRLGDDRIICWDIRKSNDVLAAFPRKLYTQQPAMFGFVHRTVGGSQQVDLVSASHGGGVLVFDGSAQCRTGEPRRVLPELGTTSGLTVLSFSTATIAVAVGTAHYAVRDRYEENAASASSLCGFGLKRSRSMEIGGEPHSEDDIGDDDGCTEAATIPGVAVFRV
uniref:Uncharacterized protein TCIL3000_11_16410 n=1 Tax=Trypanosoma congolense (strain IL3000) TaxID=1068625 RepID=G0V3A6_TRYCI|nr:unnamed protein product [Trypanosoma congolense IL3000]